MKRGFIFLIVLLLVLLIFRLKTYSENIKEYQSNERISLRGSLQNNPIVTGSNQKFSISTVGQTIFVTTDAQPVYQYGQKLEISGILTSRVLKDGRTQFSLYHPAIREVVTIAPWDKAALFVEQRAERIFRARLPQTEASLLLGIVFGRKEHFDSTFYQNLQNTGVLHIIAASGMNTSLVGMALLFIFGLFLPRRLGICLTIGGLLFYSLLAGLAPSIIRATIMAIFALAGGFWGRQYTPILGLGIAAYLMLFLNPAILTDVGFQLSFMATLGISLFQPLLAPLEKGKLGLVIGDLATTLAAQIGTLPIMLTTFGQYGLLSIPANALVLWMVPPLMILGALAVVVGMVFAPLGSLIALLCLPLLAFFEAVINWLGSMSLSFVLSSFPITCIVGYYLLLGGVLVLVRQRKKLATESVQVTP